MTSSHFTLPKTALLSCAAALSFSAPLFAQGFDPVAGFEMPESALVLPAQGQIVVSNIKGSPMEADGNGYLSLLDLDGTVIDASWVSGLDAPKGMAQLGDELLVTDLTRVHVIDVHTGQLKQSIAVEDAVFLNDVSASADQAWISDMLGHGIFTYKEGAVELALKSDEIQHPNGLLYQDGALIVGTWGQGMRDDFSTEVPGQLLKVHLDDFAIEPLTTPFANLDGVVPMGDGWIVNDWLTGHIYEVSAQGEVSDVAQYTAGLADISKFENTLYLPLMFGGTLETLTLP